MNFRSYREVSKMPAIWRLRFLQMLARLGVREETLLIGLAVLIGLAAGAATWLFEKTLHGISRYFFEDLVLRTHATTTNLYLLPLFPAAGGLALYLLRRAFRVEHSRLHGVSALLFALSRKAGILKPTLGVETLLASSLTIGAGGSAGPEAPIAIIGSSVGSLVGSLAGISRRNLPTLIGCGAAAGVSAVFNAPIAGVLFSMEVLLRDFSIRAFTPIVISSVISTVMYQTITGANGGGFFSMPASGGTYLFTFAQIPYYLALGLICGALAVLMTRSFTFIEHAFDRSVKRLPRALHPAIGAGLAGVCGVALILFFRGDPYLGGATGRFAEGYVPIFATGYPTINRVLDPQWYTGVTLASGQGVALTFSFLAIACLLKVVATSLTLGSGGSGGVFAPSLLIGAAGGGALGMLLHRLNPAIEPSTFALVGMGAVLAGVIQAPLMAIILLFELTRNYQVMLPAMLAVVVATLIQQLWVKDGFYSLPLRHEGVLLGTAAGISSLRRVGVSQVALKPARVTEPGEPVTSLVDRSRQPNASDFVLLDGKGRYLGLVTLDDVRTVMLAPESLPLLLAGDIARTNIPPLTTADTLDVAFEMFVRHEVDAIPVLSLGDDGPPKLMGLITRSDLMRRYHTELGN